MRRMTLWILLFQLSAIACTGPLLALGYIASSPLIGAAASRKELKASSRAPARQILFILPSLLLGYSVPAVVMGLPSPGMISNNFKQLALVTWNVFPITVYLIFQGLSVMFGSSSPQKDNGSYRTAIRILVDWHRRPRVAREPQPDDTHLPEPLDALSTRRAPPGFAHGTPGFLHANKNRGGRGPQLFPLGSGLRLQLRAALLARDGKSARISGWKAFVGIICGSIVVGPGSVCVALDWMRDEALMSNEEEGN